MIQHAWPQSCRGRWVENEVQYLNPVDRAMRCVDSTVRQLGYPGLETQMLVWLDGRISPILLQEAISRLSRHYPIIAARLAEPSDDREGPPYWQPRPGETCTLEEMSLLSDSPEAVLDHAGWVLSNGRDPAEADPIEFHLLHRPGGKDVLLLQYNHVLFDNPVAIPLLQELHRLSTTDRDAPENRDRKNLILRHLRQFPREQCRAAIQAAIQLQGRTLRGRSATLVPAGLLTSGPVRLRIITRTLGPTETAGLRAQAIALCGFPCVSMTVLASAFRAVHRFAPPTDEPRDFVAAIGIPMRRDGIRPLTFQNLASAVPIRLPHEEVYDRNRAIHLLSQELRERLSTGIDLGVLGTMAIFSRRFRSMEWVVGHLMRHGYSLWYACFGAVDSAGKVLCGRRIEGLYYTGGPIWPSMGLALLVNQFRGQLHLQVTFDPRLISESLAGKFLDFVLADVPRFTPSLPSLHDKRAV